MDKKRYDSLYPSSPVGDRRNRREPMATVKPTRIQKVTKGLSAAKDWLKGAFPCVFTCLLIHILLEGLGL